MFNEIYNDWNHKRGKAIIDHYGYRFFQGKKILDLGAGLGELGAMFLRLGAEITCVDAREENLKQIRVNHPAIKTVRLDLENDWPFAQHQYDIVLSLGLLCHLKNYEQHIKNICDVAEYIVLETEVLDIQDANLRTPIYEEKLINDLSFHGEGSIVSANNIQNRLSSLGAKFKRFDNDKINSGPYRYDWRETGGGRSPSNRRLWFIKRDKFIVNKLENQQRIEDAERKLQLESSPNIAPPRPATYRDNASSAVLEKVRVSSVPIISTPITANYQSENTEKIKLFYYYYENNNNSRKMEIDFCLDKNIDNKSVDLIILQSDTPPTFNFYFDKINRVAGPNDISIICNADVFFENSIGFAKNIKHNELYALDSWKWDPYGPACLTDTQNAWIIRGRVENVFGDILVDKPLAGNRIASEFNKAGYTVLNPSKTIKAYYYNDSNTKNYQEQDVVLGPYLHIDSTGL